MHDTLKAVLFDLDGTLIDSAPDLLAAINYVRHSFGLAPRDLNDRRHIVSRGATHMLAVGLDDLDGYDEDAARQIFLEHYTENYWVKTRPYAGITELLEWLERRGMPWAVVTNKSERFAEKVLDRAGWSGRAGAVVCGDTLAVAKPDPAPVKFACERLGIIPAHAVMIGDDERDILAGKRAGAFTALAEWGYLLPEAGTGGFGADRTLGSPGDVREVVSGR